MPKETNSVEARERKRLAQIALRAKRAERDKRVDDAVSAFFSAEERAARARDMLAEADAERADAVRQLVDEGMSTKDVAELLGIESKDAAALRKQTRTPRTRKSDSPTVADETVADGTVAPTASIGPRDTITATSSAPSTDA